MDRPRANGAPEPWWTSAGLLLLRLGAGGTMAVAHGWPKLAGFATKSATFSDPLGIGSKASLVLAIFGEFVCCVAVALGLGTRWVAVPPMVTMLVAALLQHAKDPFAKKELALAYALAFGTLVLLGGGRWSLDAVLAPRFRAWRARRRT